MSGLFLGPGSACNWCEESGSLSESVPSVDYSSSSVEGSIQVITCSPCLNQQASQFYEFTIVVSGVTYNYRLASSGSSCTWYNDDWNGNPTAVKVSLHMSSAGFGPLSIQLDITVPAAATYRLTFPRFPLSGRVNCLQPMTLPFLSQFGSLSWPSSVMLDAVP